MYLLQAANEPPGYSYLSVDLPYAFQVAANNVAG
jgi:hypothetical protein